MKKGFFAALIIFGLTARLLFADNSGIRAKEATPPESKGMLFAGESAKSNLANVITVAKSGGDYDTIQAAVDAATTGTTVLVLPGEYAEQVFITKPISLIGTDKNNCVVKKDVVGDGWGGSHLITIEAGIIGIVEIRNLTAYNPRTSYSGTSLIIKSDAKIKNCNLVSDSWDTVIVGLSTVHFDDCLISGRCDTLSIMGYGKGTTVYVDNCRIEARSTSTSIWTGGGDSGGVVTVYLNDCELLGESSNPDYGRIDVRSDTLIKLKYYITNTRCFRISDRALFPLFFPTEFGANMTAYIANCQYSTLGNSNVTAHYLKTSGADMNGNLKVSGAFASADSKFSVDSDGNITKINNVATSFPSSQGAAGAFLKNDGNGKLSWASADGGSSKPANVITVAKSGGDYDTIQAAVEAATTGTTVLVFPGEYVEKVVIDKSINLVGVDKVLSKIKYLTTGDYTNPVVSVLANNCSIQNLSIVNLYNDRESLGAAALTISRVNFRATNCLIESDGKDTVWVVDTAREPDGNCIIENSYIRGDFDIVSTVRSIKLLHCTIEKNDNGQCYLWANASNAWGKDVKLSSFGNTFICKDDSLAYVRGIEADGKKLTIFHDIISNDATPILYGDGDSSSLFSAVDFNVNKNLTVSGAISGNYSGKAILKNGSSFEDVTLSNFTFNGYDDNNCVWNTGDDVTQPGWTFGSDTTLYRPSANTLKTDGAFDANQFYASSVLWKDWAAAAGSGAFVYDAQSMAMTTTVNGALQFFSIPYERGTVLTRLRVKWQAQGAGDGIKVRLIKRDESGTESAWTLVGAQQTYTDADAPYDVIVSIYDFDDETMAANHSYTIEVESAVVSAGVKLFAVGLEMSKRVI